MLRKDLDFLLKENKYLKGGTKEACIKARDFLKHTSTSISDVHSNTACVSADEFIKAVKTLIAYAFQQEDTIPETWHCDNDCRKVSYILCPGECNLSKDSGRLCPHFVDDGLV